MQRYILKRLGAALFCVVAVSCIVFVLSRLSGDPAQLLLPMDTSAEDLQRFRASMGLDKPLYVQYLRFFWDAVQGDFGISLKFNDPVLPLVIGRLGATAQLVAVALAFSLTMGLTVGTVSAMKRGTWFDKFGKVFALVGQAAPTFWVGIMLILVFSVALRLLPAAGRGGILHVLMPAFTLGWYSTAAVARLTRSSMLDVLDSEFIKMTRSKGLPERYVIWKHALKNASIPVANLAGLQMAALLYGAVVTETVFAWPGMGQLAVRSIINRDFPVIQGIVLIGACLYVFMNLFVDLLCAYLDPRIRYEKA
jgi:peptide/nickel transport system permease protein